MTEQRRDDIAKLEALHAQRAGGRVFIHLAEAYRRAGEMERARAVVEEGLSNHGEYASARVVHGRILRELAKPAEAAEEFRAALEIDPHNLVALRALGELRRDAGDSTGAREYFQQLLLLDPGDEDVDRAVRDLEASAGPEFEVDDAGWGEDVDLLEVGASAGLGEAPVDAADDEDEAWAAESWGEVDLSTGVDIESDGSGLVEEAEEAAAVEGSREVPLAEEPDEAALVGEPEDAGSEEAEQEDALMVGEWATLLPDSEEEPQAESAQAADEDLQVAGSEESEGLQDVDIEDIHPGNIEGDEVGVEDVDIEDIEVEDVEVEDVDAEDVDAEDLEVEEIQVEDVDVEDVDAQDLELEDIEVGDVDVEDGEDVTASVTVEPTSEERRAEERGAEVATETMADLYARQGLHEHAAEVYQKLLDARPGDVRLEEKLEESRRQLATSRADEAAEPTAEPASESRYEAEADEEAEPELDPESEVIETADSVATEPEEADLSTAEFVEMSELTAGDGGTDAAAQSDAAAGGDRQTVDEYFSRLMSWRPAEEEFTRTLDLSSDAEYVGGGPAADGGAADAAAARSQASEPPAQESPEADEAAPDSRDAEGAAAEESESGDEDLEVFRSWLQSLKR